MNIDGTSEEQLTHDNWNLGPSWSFDSKKIVFSRYLETTKSHEIFVMNSDGTAQIQLTNLGLFSFDPVFSPDGSKIMFNKDRDILAVMNSDGSDIQELGVGLAGYFPSFSNDGEKIVFYSTDDGDSEIYLADSDGSNIMQLTNNEGISDRDARFNQFGHIVFTSDRDGDEEIYTMSQSGENIIQLTINDIDDALPDW